MNPKISVIVPVYNVEDYLKECVDSILAQSYNNFELILVNDGSTDSSYKICEEYLKQNNTIKLINKPNGGLSSARNAGIEIATGEFLSFIDSDDFIHKDFLKILIEPMIENPDIKITASSYSKEVEGLSSKSSIINFYNFEQYTYIPEWTTAWGKIYAKECFETVRYPEGRLHEDNILWKILYKLPGVWYTDAKLYYYRQRSSSIVANFKLKNYMDLLFLYKESYDFCKKEGITHFCNNSRHCIGYLREKAKKNEEKLPAREKKIVIKESTKILKSICTTRQYLEINNPKLFQIFLKIEQNLTILHEGGIKGFLALHKRDVE